MKHLMFGLNRSPLAPTLVGGSLLLLVGCEVTEKVGEGVDTSATASSSVGNTGVATGGPSTGGSVGSTGGPATTTGLSEASTDGNVSTGSGTTDAPGAGSEEGDTGSGSEGSGTEGGAVVYGASVGPLPAASINIYKADFGAGTCQRIRLETPTPKTPTLDSITTPQYYTIYAAEISQEPDNCASFEIPMTRVEPTNGSGTIAWEEEGPSACPVDIDIDVTLNYPAGQAWVPESDAFVGLILVDGCPL